MSKSKKSKNKKTNKNWIFQVFFIVVILLGALYIAKPELFNKKDNHNPSLNSTDTSKGPSADFIKAVVSNQDTNERIIYMSDSVPNQIESGYDESAGKNIRRVYSGRRINIAITGVDSRIGTSTKHADANHVLSLLLDSGKIEIISVPRDTPADAGYPDTCNLNKLTIVRAGLGREAYLKELAKIAEVDKIHYYVEFGFSQAMGILEFLGYENSSSTLQVLRSRQGLGGDDYQRQYNQGQFIKQTILSNFGRLDGIIGDVLLRGALSMVETNLDYSTAKSLFEKMKNKNFAHTNEDVSIKIRPSIPVKFKIYDFTDMETLTQLNNRIKNYNQSRAKSDTTFSLTEKPRNVASVLNNAILNAAKDTLKNPASAIKKLTVYFDQRAWLQVSDKSQRDSIRARIATIMINSYNKRKEFAKAQQIHTIVESEKNLFNNAKSQLIKK